ncbi:hypothetical protein HMPREF9124_0599 [Oribacterium sp. oral taxon 108 str. F0425]|nr:hypothetical protein HMPREF9124_0599 [Oribacterium sp. oral taxon 108 str. F0425]
MTNEQHTTPFCFHHEIGEAPSTKVGVPADEKLWALYRKSASL